MRRLLMTAAALPMLLGAPLLAATSPESAACSAQADAKGLHGADREAFRATCLKAATPAAATPVPAAKPVAAPKPAVAAAPAAKPATFTAKSPASQACSAQADAKGLHGADREAFRTTCLKGAAPAAATPATVAVAQPAAAKPAVAKPTVAKPVVAAAAPPEPGSAASKAAKAAPGTRSPAQLAADQRIHQCGQQWQAAKAANRIPAGQTWPQYWSACSARLKAA